jgi:hypothetical protein
MEEQRMIAGLLKLLSKIPQPWRLILILGIVFAAGALIFTLFSQIGSCRYDKARKEYEEKSKAWATERAVLIASAEAKEKRIAELEPKAIAFDALAEQNKKIDAGLAKQIEEVSKNAADEEARAEMPTDCRARAQRVCDLLSANHIKHDCAAITAESCGPR